MGAWALNNLHEQREGEIWLVNQAMLNVQLGDGNPCLPARGGGWGDLAARVPQR